MTRYWKYNLLFLLPALILFTSIVYYPLVYTFVWSFSNSTGYQIAFKDLDFIGFHNYSRILSDADLMKPFINTLKFTLFTAVVMNIMQLGLALALDQKLKSRNFLRASFYIPALLSGTVISSIFTYILQYRGALNWLFLKFGLDSWVNDWFGNMHTALQLIMSIQVWEYLGFGAVIYMAGLQSIPVDYYEAAKIDGANFFDKFRNITFPLLMPSITVLTFLAIVGGMKLFDLPFIITNGGPAGATETISTYIYKLNSAGKVGLASAMGMLLLLLIILMTVIQLTVTRKREVEF